uniref:Large ribosomal subunit protein bL9c n=1 Tax=Sonderella linearis TaxID=110477 RepID=A0A1Z1MMU5_9FLOR|nr:ribosomal protein L9 [Sonderella linearis]ARW67115.1 ribosomal protein L9 [Sonderella linearis]
MTKKIKIILIKDSVNIGQKGNIVNVSYGYAFNYLIPNNIASIATKKRIKHLNMFKDIEKEQKKENEIIINRIEETITNIQKISIYRKTGKNKMIFGNIKEKDVIHYFLNNIGIQLNKKQINLPNINQSGSFNLKIQMIQNIEIKIALNILPTNI